MAVSREHVTTAVHGALQASRQQQLKQVQLPPHVYELARKFTTSVPWNDDQQKLVRFVGIPMLYSLLCDKVGNKQVDEGEQEFNSLQEASEAVLRYPMNLLLAPNRPEFRRISLSTSFWIYHISRKFPKARQILLQMGYQETPGGKGRSKDLILKGSSSNEQILSVAVDLVILREELDVLKELARRIKPLNSHTSLYQIISVRASGPASLETCFQILRQYPVSFTESRPQHRLEDSYSHCWNDKDITPTSSLLARGLATERDGTITNGQSFSPEPLNLPSPIMSQSELKRLIVPTPSIHTPSVYFSPPAATERGTPTYDNHKPHLSDDSKYVYIKNENNSSIPVNNHSHRSNRGLQNVIADSGVVVSPTHSYSTSTTSLPQSPTSRSPPSKKPALSSLSSYESASLRVNGYGNNQSSSNMLHRGNIAGPAPTKGWVCLKCYIWNSAGSIYCNNASCHAPAPAESNSSAPSSLSSENVGRQYHNMRHATSSPSFELDHPPFSVASNIPPKFHSSPDSHSAAYSSIGRDHLAIPAPSRNYHLSPSPPRSPAPYLPPYSAASSTPISSDPPLTSWTCYNCGHVNSADLCGCPYCGELAPWIEP